MFESIRNSRFSIEENLHINGEGVKKNVLNTLKINVGKIPSDNRIHVFAHVMDTDCPGPRMLVIGGIHGNEINGVEIVRRLIENKIYDKLHRGSLIIIPLLNVYGFINFSRDVFDGKDVNRSFPGHLNGSLASRVARVLTKYFLPVVDVAMDFHTGGNARFNYPQIRFNKNDPRARDMALASNVPFIIEQPLLAHSFRKSSYDMKVPAVVYEGGESIRLNGHAIQTGYDSILHVLQAMDMIDAPIAPKKENQILIKKTTWIRASDAGMFIWLKQSGDEVSVGEILGQIKDPFGLKSVNVISKFKGYIIGHNNASVVYLGDALFHIGVEFENI
ncbi:MAG: succinylglutamate desuccinylase/aspartoacylase family protein [Lewinellaceae bacterium]|nr:succinylglutamate desuccinylase/aspartoacylase family protein [Lewinellaceae bacterium]